MDTSALRGEVRARFESQGVTDRLSKSVAAALMPKDGKELVEPDVELHTLIAANLLEDSELGRVLPGLATALRSMAAKMPEDPTEWLCARLKASRPVVVREYTESVLKAHVMKCDEFEDIHLLKTERPHPQAWNFRRTDANLPVFGSGQCHLDGIIFLAQHLKKDLGFQRVLWFNMREEPVVFLNGQACAPRTDGNMNENVEYLAQIEGYELDAMERRLRDDCVEAAAEAPGGTLGVYYQKTGGSNVEEQLPAPRATSLPVREAYDRVNEAEGAPEVVYSRVPITDETAPEEKDFDQLVAELRATALACTDETALVFNCQMGRGRTTTGMVCGSILLLAVRGWKPPPSAPKALPTATSDGRNLVRGEFKGILQLLALMDEELQPAAAAAAVGAAAGGGGPGGGKLARRGSTMVMPAGVGLQAKLLADECIDACAHAQNMVEAIVACQQSAGKAEIGAARSPEFWLRRGRNYLERYASILLFAAYALQEAKGGFEVTYSEWSHRHWQFKRVMKHLVLE